jgi:predicted metal-binding protein
MRRTPLRRIGKRGRINIEANKILKKIYQKKGIDRCEIKFVGCLSNFTCAFAHKHKRNWYYDKPELLSSFDETVLACVNCHDKIEKNKELTELVFKDLRG